MYPNRYLIKYIYTMKVTVHFFSKKGTEYVYPTPYTLARLFGGYKIQFDYINTKDIEVLDDDSITIPLLRERAAEEGLITEVVPIEEELGTYLSTYNNHINRTTIILIKSILMTLLMFLILYILVKIYS